VHLVQSAADVDALELADDTPVAYVTQTTLSVDDTREVIAALKQRFRDLVGPDIKDICYATQNRQKAVRELAAQVDLILVVGATNSSNSNRLREIAAESGVPSHLVADGSEVQAAWVEGAGTVGVTAGASAPEALVEDVIDALGRLVGGPVEVTTMRGEDEALEFRLPRQLTDDRRHAAAS
jgi:4-hydroxy-3-methylbut-2-enyl diphosphate reductase